MRINSLYLYNFRPYFGEHAIDLTTSGQSSLVIVFGENMRGKTALLHAIRWVLYAEAFNRLGEQIPICQKEKGDQLLNSAAQRKGDYRVEVRLNFSHDGRSYDLRRVAEPGLTPDTYSQANVKSFLTKDGEAVGDQDIDTTVSDILNKEISRFCLFDGEMLSEYEKLLRDEDKEAQLVKNAIEKTLGLPAITMARDQVDEVATEFEKDFHSMLRKEKKNEEKVTRIEEIEDQIGATEKDLASFIQTRQDAAEEKQLAERELREHEEYSNSFTKYKHLESTIEEIEKRIAREYAQIRNDLNQHWWLALSDKIRSLRDEFDEQLRKEIEISRNVIQAELVQQTLSDDQCALCDSQIDQTKRIFLQQHLNELSTSQSSDPTRMARLHDHIMFLNQYLGEQHQGRIVAADEKIMRERTELAQRQADERELREVIGQHSRDDHESKMLRYEEIKDSIVSLDDHIAKLKERIDQLTSDRDKIQRELERSKGVDRTTQLQASGARLIHSVFSDAVDQFREAARERVSKAANHIFKSLTTEPSYTGLTINNNYGLRIIDSDGHEIPGRSAGAEQIVALSLIGGLNRSAVSGETPVVMDTNFGRLDRGHRGNILRWVASLEQQVILLVHSGELQEQEMTEYGVTYARKYKILRGENELMSEISSFA